MLPTTTSVNCESVFNAKNLKKKKEIKIQHVIQFPNPFKIEVT